ncbi:sensor histidine kinase [Kiritimatiella glycovorans]|uniref:histidine kinase n=1 Tax=Kiritimatiella glycovorans TaxID=1307763 RepID=A0A0G3EAZ7_9BACT|nr:sensor histidine kinase [Kiritimatiella glycovorans]AKJ63661.1 Sensor histidine kinase CitA [Kiritimatiella glycovorans]
MHATLSDILSELAANAAEAGSREVDLAVVERGPEVLIEVADDGRGMDEAERLRALDPCFSGSGAHPGREAGLGLAFALQAAESAGGAVDIDSKPGEGTRVRARFDRTNIDTPPEGDWVTAFLMALGIPGADEVRIRHERGARAWSVARSSLAARLGGLERARALNAARRELLERERTLEADGREAVTHDGIEEHGNQAAG